MIYLRNAALLGILLSCFCLITNAEAFAGTTKPNRRPITNPKFDPSAEAVELFEAIEAGQVEARLIPSGAFSGRAFIENRTDKPLNVKVPDAVIAVPVNAQFGGGFGGGGLGGGGLAGGGPGGQQGGGQQTLGGGFGGGIGGGFGGGLGGGGFGGGGQLGGGGFFSIPPERVVAVKFNSVCLQHGRPEPSASSRYRFVPLSKVSEDPVLHGLLTVVGSGSVDSMAAQAAAWAVSDRMSWQQLADKSVTHLAGQPSTPYFTRDQLLTGQQLLAQAVDQSKSRKEEAGRSGTPRTPAVGGVMDFELTSLAGEKVKLAQLNSKGPVVIVVLRGFPGYQCPLCTKQYGDFMEHAEAFKAAGASVAFIYPGSSQKLKDRAADFVRGKDCPSHFQILLDPDYTFTAANGLRWDEKGETAYPSTFVVDGGRKVTFASISRTHGGRVKAADVLQALAGK